MCARVCVCPLKVLQGYMLQKRERVCLYVCVPFQVLQVCMFMEESVCMRACVCWEALGTTGSGCWPGGSAACILALRRLLGARVTELWSWESLWADRNASFPCFKVKAKGPGTEGLGLL